MKSIHTPSNTAVVLLGGGHVTPASVGELPAASLVIAADSGAHHAEVLGLPVHVVVGDLDSVNRTALDALSALGAEVVSHPVDKNETDAELALLHAAGSRVTRVVIVGAGGGRLDHQLSLFALLFHDCLRGLEVEARIGASRTYPLRSGESRAVSCRDGDVVGLIPFGGDAHGITTRGLQWPLTNESLVVTASRGVSNRATSTEFHVSLREGRLLVTIDRPDHSGEESGE